MKESRIHGVDTTAPSEKAVMHEGYEFLGRFDDDGKSVSKEQVLQFIVE